MLWWWIAGCAKAPPAVAVADGPDEAPWTLTPATWPDSTANDIVLTPDERIVVLATERGPVDLWDLQTGAFLQQLTGHEGPVHAVDVSADGTRLLSAGQDRTVRLWELPSGAPLGILQIHDSWIPEAVFTRDGTRVVSASYADGVVRLWNAETGDVVQELGPRPYVDTIVVPEGDTHAVALDDDGVSVWALDTGLLEHRFEADDEFAAVSANGMRAAVLRAEAPGGVYDTLTGERVLALPGAYDAGVIQSVVLSPDGSWLALDHQPDDMERGEVHIWDVASGEITTRLDSDPYDLVPSPDGRRICTIRNGAPPTQRVFDVSEGTLVAGFDADHRVAVFTRDGRTLVSGWGTPTVWDVDGNAPRYALGTLDWPASVSAEVDGTTLVITHRDGMVAEWDLGSGRHVGTIVDENASRRRSEPTPTAHGPWRIEPDSRGATRIVDAATGDLVAQLRTFGDGRWLVTTPDGSWDGSDAGFREFVWERDGEVVPFETHASATHRPGLLAAVLQR